MATQNQNYNNNNNMDNQSNLQAIQEVKYELLDGTQVILNEQVIKNLTNNNKNITNGEINLFIEQAKMLKVNPLIGEYQLVKYDTSKPAQYILHVNAFQRVADVNTNFDGMEDGIVVQKINGEIVEREGCIVYPKETLLGGWAKAYRKDRKIPVVAKVGFNEFNKGQSTWRSMPATMINKCAKVACLRKAFPSLFGNTYSEEELVASGALENDDNAQQKEYDIDGIVDEKKVEDNVVGTVEVQQEPQYQEQPYQNQNYNNGNDGYYQDYSQPQQPNYNYNQNGYESQYQQAYQDNVNYQNQPQGQAPQQFEVDYKSEYLPNKHKYNLVPQSYNNQTKTCLVTLKPEYQNQQ